METAADQARSFSADVVELQAKWRDKLGRVRSDAAVLRLIELLPKFPILTTATAEAEIGRSRPVTIEALDRLRSIGALTRHSNRKKGDSWEAKGLFKLLDEFEEAARRPSA